MFAVGPAFLLIFCYFEDLIEWLNRQRMRISRAIRSEQNTRMAITDERRKSEGKPEYKTPYEKGTTISRFSTYSNILLAYAPIPASQAGWLRLVPIALPTGPETTSERFRGPTGTSSNYIACIFPLRSFLHTSLGTLPRTRKLVAPFRRLGSGVPSILPFNGHGEYRTHSPACRLQICDRHQVRVRFPR
jgi:hypothetical protein